MARRGIPMKAAPLSVLIVLVFLIASCQNAQHYNTDYKDFDTIVTLGTVNDGMWQELPQDGDSNYLAHQGDCITVKTEWVSTAGPEIPPYDDISINLAVEPSVVINGNVIGPMPTGEFSLRVVHYRRSATWAAWEKSFTIIVE